MISKKTIFNPFTKALQFVQDENQIAEKEHPHTFRETKGLKNVIKYFCSKYNEINLKIDAYTKIIQQQNEYLYRIQILIIVFCGLQIIQTIILIMK